MSVQLPNGQNNGSGNSGSSNGTGNNTTPNTNEPVYQDPWDPKLAKPKDPNSQQPQNNQTQPQNQNGSGNQSGDVMKQFETYVENLDFGFKLPAETDEALKTAGITGLDTAIQSAMRSVFKQAIFDAQKMMNGVSEKAANVARQTATNMQTTEKLKTQLGEAIPTYKSSSALAPAIEGAYARYTGAGFSHEESIGMTKQWLKKVGKSLMTDGYTDDEDGQTPQRRGGSDANMDWAEFAKTA